LWAAWKGSGEITVIDVVPEWIANGEVTGTWHYLIPPPDCTDGDSEWICIVHEKTGFLCDACTLWAEENAALVSS
jgi:hypothetical protein